MFHFVKGYMLLYVSQSVSVQNEFSLLVDLIAMQYLYCMYCTCVNVSLTKIQKHLRIVLNKAAAAYRQQAEITDGKRTETRKHHRILCVFLIQRILFRYWFGQT